jgi:hypothetical protein
LLEPGHEFEPSLAEDFDPFVVESLVRLTRLAESASELLRDCPDAQIRRSAAVLAARAHPVRAALDT